MPFFRRDKIKFHYLDRGRGLPFFFQHGLGGETGKIFAQLKTPPGFRLLGLDCRGHGKTRPLGQVGKLRFDSMADDLIALMRHLHIERAVIGGTSMGAGVALNCALRYPKRVLGLVLLRPAWLNRPNQSNATLFGFIAKLIRLHDPGEAFEIFKKSDAYLNLARECPDSAASLLSLFIEPRARETVARFERIPRDAPNRDRSEWRQIKMPTLVMTTQSDPIHLFQFGKVLAREIPGARFEELTPKSINLEQYTSQLRRCIGDFLQSQFQRPAARRSDLRRSKARTTATAARP
jgi:pimeloyl-ACP methyl ester carboxylesterase